MRYLFSIAAVLFATGCGGSLDSLEPDPYGFGKGEGAAQPIQIDSMNWIVGLGFLQVAEKDSFGSPIIYDPSTGAAPQLFVRVTMDGMPAGATTPAMAAYQTTMTPHEDGRLLSNVPGSMLRAGWRFEVYDQQAAGPWLIADCFVQLTPTELDGLSQGNPLVRRRYSECGAVNSDELRRLERIEFHIIQDASGPAPAPATSTAAQQLPADTASPVDPQTPQTQTPQTPQTQTPQTPAASPYVPGSSEAVSGCNVVGSSKTTPSALLLLLLVVVLRRRR